MRIDPAIAALQADPGRQRHAQEATFAACNAWRERPLTARALADLAQFGAGAPLERCPTLEALFTDQVAAGNLARSFCAGMAETLEAEPFGHPPVRHGWDGQVSTLLLARAGRAQLILTGRETGSYPADRVSFSDAVRFEAILAGTACARLVRPAGETFDVEDIPLREGVRLALHLASESLQVTQVERRLVSLRLHRFSPEPDPTREFSMADGALLHQASGDLGASRREMMIAVLGRMKIAHAAPTMAAMAAEPGDSSMRWQALRECLALDTAQGFRALLGVARTADDPLCAAAGALRAQLIEAHPQLLALEQD